jgi:ATP-independent RNA helicase DbpA
VYTHRIGRTGRAGNEGAALSLFFENERFRVDALLERGDNAGAARVKTIESVSKTRDTPTVCSKQTLSIAGGRKNKIRPGDILGTLTAEGGIPGTAIGRIDILDFASFVAIDIPHIEGAIAQLEARRIKGQKFKVRRLHTIATRTGRARN